MALTGTPQKLKVQIKTAVSGKFYIDGVSLIYSNASDLTGELALPLGQ
jgi:hypothetical protein